MAIEFALIPQTNKILFSPNIDKIYQLAIGNVGIADNIKKASDIYNLSSIDDNNAIKSFIQLSKIELPKPIESYISPTTNRIRIPLTDVKTSLLEDTNGLKALEITTIKTIFESQKPYMEITAIICKSMVDIEDIIARVLAIADKSLKPYTNPNALGFKFKDFKSDVNKLQNLNNTEKQNKGKKTNTNPFDRDFEKDPVKPTDLSQTTYQVLGVEYSTGVFIPTIQYQTIYHDLESDQIVIDDEDSTTNETQSKPVIADFLILNSQGIQIDPPDWLKNSGKWYGQFPQVGSFEYIWKRGEETVVSLGTPKIEDHGIGWERTENKIFNAGDVNYYKNYYETQIDETLSTKTKVDDGQKQNIKNIVSNKLDINNQLTALSDGGYVNEFTPKIFLVNNSSMLPKQVSFSNSNVWLDPESEYDLKFIKIDSTLDINFFEQNDKKIETKIQRFLFNTLNISFSDNAPYDINIIKNNFTPLSTLSSSNITSNQSSIQNITILQLDNLTSNFEYIAEIDKRTPPDFFKPIFWITGYESSARLSSPSFINPITSTSSSTNNVYEYNYIYTENSTWRYDKKTITLSLDAETLKRQLIGLNKIPNGDPIANGTYEIPNKFGKIIIKNGLIYAWKTPNLSFTNIDGIIKNITINSNNLTKSENTLTLQFGSIRVDSNDSRFGKIINKTQIRNEQLSISTAYSNDEYGTDKIQQLFRYRTSLDDTETFYIIEGKLQTDNSISSTNLPSSVTSVNKKYYTKPHAIGAVKKFNTLLIGILTELVPSINTLLELIKDPKNFLTTIIKDKLGENFELFNPQLISKFNSLEKMDPSKIFAFIEENPDLKKYVSSTKSGSYLHVLDGKAIINFLTIRFGLELKKLKINLIFDKLRQPSQQSGGDPNNGGATNLSNIPGSGIKTENITTTDVNGNRITEEIDVLYSTNNKSTDINYNYVYLSSDVANLIKDFDDNFKREDFEAALENLLQAQSLDPKNEFIAKKLIELKDKVKKSIQPILDFLLNIVTMPLKIVLEIIKYIKSIFESIDIATIVPTFADFITFKWIMKFVSKDFILGLIGIKMDLDKLHYWKKNYASFPKEQMFDLSEIFSAPFFPKLPTVPKEYLQFMLPNICEIVNAVLKVIEGIINAVIDLIWAPITLDAVIPQPYVKLTRPCSASSQGLSADQIFDLINGINTNGLENFAFDVKLSDGRNVKDLSREDLDDFIKANPKFQFSFEF